MKKYLFLGTTILVLATGSYFSELRFLSYSNLSASAAATSAADSKISPQASAKPTGIDFTLNVGGQTYRGTAPAGATVLDAMKVLASNSDFRFTSKDFSGMGAFVESVNGKKNGDGLYWILYINGKSLDVGASSAIIKYGDTVEWRYEKSN